uniref:F-box only protein 48-like n=1 Tax=Petromyzon marinus TaxID=7757 RepID=A0AAJ7TP20_PETMA|nr:F-box only protein 48-like [Petromyzon marinus]
MESERDINDNIQLQGEHFGFTKKRPDKCSRNLIMKSGRDVNDNIQLQGEHLDFMKVLPEELILKILVCLDPQSICQSMQVCLSWKDFISEAEPLWKSILCTHYMRQKRAVTGAPGTYKDLVRKYGRWFNGHNSHLCSAEEAQNIMCPMGVNEWGMIFERELGRITANIPF